MREGRRAHTARAPAVARAGFSPFSTSIPIALSPYKKETPFSLILSLSLSLSPFPISHSPIILGTPSALMVPLTHGCWGPQAVTVCFPSGIFFREHARKGKASPLQEP